MLLRLSCLALSSVFTVMRLLPVSSTEKDIEILALRHQLAVLQRQIDRPRFTGTDRVSCPHCCITCRRSDCGSCR